MTEKETNPLLLEQATELLSKLPMSNDWALLSYGEQVVDYLVYTERAGVIYNTKTQTDTLTTNQPTTKRGNNENQNRSY